MKSAVRCLTVLPLGGTALASSVPGFQDPMDGAVARMHSGTAAAPTTGNVDQDFLAMMIQHHQVSVDAAQAVLAPSKNPQVKRLAQEILTEQTLDIGDLLCLQKRLEHHSSHSLMLSLSLTLEGFHVTFSPFECRADCGVPGEQCGHGGHAHPDLPL